jgi:hypothetical protein
MADAPADKLAEIEEEKDDQVLEREPLETELMKKGKSQVGEKIGDAQGDEKGE